MDSGQNNDIKKNKSVDDLVDAEASAGAATGTRKGNSRLKAEVDTLRSEVVRLKAELDERSQLFLRLQADFDNFRKRTSSRQGEVLAQLREEIVLQILPVMDNLERALQAAESTSDCASLADGVAMTHRQFCDILSRIGVEMLDPAGRDFDPATCEAITFGSDADQADGVVLQELQKGYRMAGKVIRPAMVEVNRLGQQKNPA